LPASTLLCAPQSFLFRFAKELIGLPFLPVPGHEGWRFSFDCYSDVRALRSATSVDAPLSQCPRLCSFFFYAMSSTFISAGRMSLPASGHWCGADRQSDFLVSSAFSLSVGEFSFFPPPLFCAKTRGAYPFGKVPF